MYTDQSGESSAVETAYSCASHLAEQYFIKVNNAKQLFDPYAIYVNLNDLVRTDPYTGKCPYYFVETTEEIYLSYKKYLEGRARINLSHAQFALDNYQNIKLSAKGEKDGEGKNRQRKIGSRTAGKRDVKSKNSRA